MAKEKPLLSRRDFIEGIIKGTAGFLLGLSSLEDLVNGYKETTVGELGLSIEYCSIPLIENTPEIKK